MNLKKLTQFLIELEFSNSKAWFDQNRPRYLELRLEFIDFVTEVIAGVSSFDASVKGIRAKDCLFRINRDVRFSQNKNPYKTNFSAALSAGGRHSSYPIYYVQLGIENSITAGGIYAPPNDQLALIRRFIERHSKKADALLRNKALLEEFGGLDKDAILSRFPKGFPSGSELLKYKSFTASSAFDALELGSAGVLKEVVTKCAKMQALHKYLREALTYDS